MVTKNNRWALFFSKRAKKDAKKISHAGLKKQLDKVLDQLEINPLQAPPSYEKLLGDLKGFYSRRINIQYRVVYAIDVATNVIKIYSMFGHYE